MEHPAQNLPPTQQGAEMEKPESRNLARKPRKKLDLSHLSPPENLEEARLEEFTIDGICGVY